MISLFFLGFFIFLFSYICIDLEDAEKEKISGSFKKKINKHIK